MKPDELRTLIDSHLEQNEYSKSLVYSEELIMGHPADLVFEDHSKAGYCYLMLERESDAVDCYSQALKLKSDDALALANRGASYFNLGRTDEAFADFHAALKLKADLFIPWHYIGLHYMRKYMKEGGDDLLLKMVNAYRRLILLVPDYGSFTVRYFGKDTPYRLDEFLILNQDLRDISLEELVAA
jgi:tetratricopeptide (TPR) repeat protein